MDFSPFNDIVKLCLQGMELEEEGKSEKHVKYFLQGWNEAKKLTLKNFFQAIL